MEATHFIELYKFFGRSVIYTSDIMPIKDLQKEFNKTFIYEGETIAVWKIKPAYNPIQDRLRVRGLLKPYYNSMWEQRIENIKNANSKLQSSNMQREVLPPPAEGEKGVSVEADAAEKEAVQDSIYLGQKEGRIESVCVSPTLIPFSTSFMSS